MSSPRPTRARSSAPRSVEADRLRVGSPEHRAWLERGREEPLEPELEICDPHVHLWDRPGDRYLLDELRADTGGGHDVRQVVYVECGASYRPDGPEQLRPVGETAAAVAAARASEQGEGARITGIVCHADLRLGAEVEAVLAAHLEVGQHRIRGVRHATTWDGSPQVRRGHRTATPGLLGESGFRAGLAALARNGLCFDAWLYHPQLGELAAAARAVPELTVVLDHLGGPLGVGPYRDREHVRSQWRRSIAEVARCDNVVVKLGGIGMPIFGLGWEQRSTPPSSAELADAWGPDIAFVIEQFGVERCMFESNYPVDGRSAHYSALWNAYKRICVDASDRERRWLFHDTAVRTYGLAASGRPARPTRSR
jgi:L-fuconolactonase